MREPCPNCGSIETRSGRRSRSYYNRHGPVVAPGCLAVVLLTLGCALFAVGEWLLPAYRLELFVLGAVIVVAPVALPFYYLGYKRAYYVRQRCLTCKHRWRVLTFV